MNAKQEILDTLEQVEEHAVFRGSNLSLVLKRIREILSETRLLGMAQVWHSTATESLTRRARLPSVSPPSNV